MPLRGKLNFCQSCATERPMECLAHLDGTGSKSRWPSILLAVLSLGLLVGVVSVAVKMLPFHDSVDSQIPPASSESEIAPVVSPFATIAPATNSAPIATGATEVRETATPWLKRLFTEPNRRPVEDAGNIHLLFVTRPGTDSRSGLSSLLYVTREAPNQDSAKLTTDVGSDMATSFDEGLRYVKKQPRNWERDFSIRLSFEDKFTTKDGGSAGTGFTIAMLAATQGIALDPEVAVTGDLTIDGTVQPVGAVVEKLRGAIDGQCKITLIPERNSRDPVDLALLDGTSPLWETQIFSIGTIDEALGLARKDRAGKVSDAIARFNALRARLPAVVTSNFLQSPVVQTELKEVLRSAPNHLSAAILLRAAENQLPQELSLNRSVEEIIAASYLFVSDIINPEERKPKSSDNKGITVFPEREFNQCLKSLQRLSPMLDRRSLELKSSCLTYAGCLRSVWTYRPADPGAIQTRSHFMEIAKRERGFMQQAKDDFDQARSHVILALRKLDTDGSLKSERLKK
jgi:hypothetical protein